MHAIPVQLPRTDIPHIDVPGAIGALANADALFVATASIE
jgi:hypothetical protein